MLVTYDLVAVLEAEEREVMYECRFATLEQARRVLDPPLTRVVVVDRKCQAARVLNVSATSPSTGAAVRLPVFLNKPCPPLRDLL